MIDWLADNGWAVWLAFAALLALAELVILDLVLLMFAVGALAAAVIAAFGGSIYLAIAVFAIVSLLMLFLVRPSVVVRLHAGPTLMTGHQVLVGRTAVVVEPVDKRTGRVQLAGELWSARALDESTYDTGTEVIVTSIDGATAVVTTLKEL